MENVVLNMALPADKVEVELKTLALACNRINILTRQASDMIKHIKDSQDSDQEKLELLSLEYGILRGNLRDICETFLDDGE